LYMADRLMISISFAYDRKGFFFLGLAQFMG
jgi:hypothetical protein